MNRTETASYPGEIIQQAGMDMISPQQYLRAKILRHRPRDRKEHKGALIRIDRNQRGIYFEESFPSEEEARRRAEELNLLTTPQFDEQTSSEIFLAVTGEGELIQTEKDKRNAVPKS